MRDKDRKVRPVFAHLRVHGLGASIEARERGGAPVALCDEGRRRVTSVSPAAWARGVRPGMSLWEAQQRCPELVVAEPNPEKYDYFWGRVLEVCGDYAPRVGGGALPRYEVALDLTGGERLFGPAGAVAREIRNRVRVEVGAAVSVGIGPSPMVARLACEAAGPGEVVEVEPGRTAEFVGELPIEALPGVGEELAERLAGMGLRRAKDLAALPADAVARALGELGERLWEIARGGDPGAARAGEWGWEAGVFSVQTDLRPATQERERLRAAVRAVSEEAGRRLRQRGQAARQVRVTVVFGDMRKVGVRRTLPQAAQSGEVLFQAAWSLLERIKLGDRLVRRVRVGVGRLAVGPDGGQLGLPLLEQEARRERLAARVDQVKDRFGEGALRPASALRLSVR